MSKKIMIFCLFGFCSIQGQWINQSSGINGDLRDICFVDSVHGWTVSKSTVLSTTNSGDDWIRQEVPIETLDIRKVQFVNQDVGYIIGNNGLIMKSENGGINWQHSRYETDYIFTGLSFIDELTGWISGYQETDTLPVGVILHSDDGGYTWDKQLELHYEKGIGSTSFRGIEFSNSNDGFTYGSHNLDPLVPTRIYSTTNGGETWNMTGRWESWVVKEIKFASSDTLWGTYPFIISFDGGIKWEYNESVFNDWIRTISPINGMDGWGYYSNFNTKEKAIVYTSDGGTSWDEDLILEGSSVTAMDQIDGKYLWICGEDGMIKMRSSNPTDIADDNTTISVFVLEQNYPNPFNPETSISFYLPKSSKIKLMVLDALGREIETLFNDQLSSGKHSVKFDGTTLSSGVYLYRLVTDNKIITKKMVLTK